MLIASRWMPKRTAKGYAVLRHTLGFKRFIDESEKHRAQFAERANIFSEYLPYAVVFGATEKWAKAFEGLADRRRHVVVVRVAARVQLRGVLERHRRLRGHQRGHAHVVTRVERIERVQRRRLLRRRWRRRRRRLLVVEHADTSNEVPREWTEVADGRWHRSRREVRSIQRPSSGRT